MKVDTLEVIQIVELEALTAAEVATAINQLKSGKAAGGDEIRPETLKSLAWEGILWLTRVCQLAFKLEKTLKNWQTGAVIVGTLLVITFLIDRDDHSCLPILRVFSNFECQLTHSY